MRNYQLRLVGRGVAGVRLEVRVDGSSAWIVLAQSAQNDTFRWTALGPLGGPWGARSHGSQSDTVRTGFDRSRS